jgi:hypothetical protein
MKLGAIGVALLILASLSACGGNPPQIVDYSPERGAKDVPTTAPIRISFDHDVNQASVESRLHLDPATNGTIHWLSLRQLTYEHATLAPNTSYQVVLEAGYADLSGNAYMLRHHWSFTTELPPSLVASTPANSDTAVDPASYLTLDFTRAMDASSLIGAITIDPSVPFSVSLDPVDGRRAIVIPDSLLAPSTTYTLAVTTAALDADGNQVDRDQTVQFTTDVVHPLRHWVAFSTLSAVGTLTGVWVVNESRFPRELFASGTVQSFTWSPEGDRLVIRGDGETWSTFTPGAGSVQLPFHAIWAAALASGLGYVYLDDLSTLHRLGADGVDDLIAPNVALAAVAPSGARVAYAITLGSSSAVWAYDVGLKARYQLALEAAPISDLSWAPGGNRIAYLRHDVATTNLRVRNLTGSGDTVTIASGDLGPPAWLPDSTHIVFAAKIATPGGTSHKAFLVSAIAPPAALSSALGIPSDQGVDVVNPIPSPDGHQIAFLSGDQVWLMNADGTRPTPLTRFDAGSFPYSCRAPAWTRA